MKIRKYIAYRLISSIFVLFGLSLLIFSLSRIVPGDPARLALGPMAPQWAVDKLRSELHLDKPIYMQYYHWVVNVLHGNLGKSLVTRRQVVNDIFEFFPATFELVIFSILISSTFAILLGVTSGRYANSWWDNLVRVTSYIGIAIPSFVWAILSVFIFGYILRWFPTLGRLSSGVIAPPKVTGFLMLDSLITGRLSVFTDAFYHMILPGSALVISRLSQEARITRASVVENLNKDYIMAARSFGIPERTVTLKHLLKPSLIPTVAVMGMDIAGSMGGSFIIETIFNWPGIGRYGMSAMLSNDINAIVGVVMLIGVFFAFMNILVDLITAYLDPRIMMKLRSN
jgi:peptide/nickel transport system permease protein